MGMKLGWEANSRGTRGEHDGGWERYIISGLGTLSNRDTGMAGECDRLVLHSLSRLKAGPGALVCCLWSSLCLFSQLPFLTPSLAWGRPLLPSFFLSTRASSAAALRSTCRLVSVSADTSAYLLCSGHFVSRLFSLRVKLAGA